MKVSFPSFALIAKPDARDSLSAKLIARGFSIEPRASLRLHAIHDARELEAFITTKKREDIALVVTDERAILARAESALGPEVLRFSSPEREFTQQLALIVRAIDLETRLQEERADHRSLVEINELIASALDVSEVLFTVAHRLANASSAERVSIIAFPSGMAARVGYILASSDNRDLQNLVLDLARYPELRQLIETNAPVLIDDTESHPLFEGTDDAFGGMFHYRSMHLFPLIAEKRTLGALALRSRAPSPASTRLVRLCSSIATALAGALRSSRAFNQLRDRNQQVSTERYEAERKLRETARFASLYENAAEGIACIDSQGRLIFGNRRAMEISGLNERTGPGQDVSFLVHPDDRQRTRELWRSFRRGEYPRGIDIRLVPRGIEDPVVCSCSFAPLPEEEGTVIVSLMDVTEQRRVEADLIKTMGFLESLVEASVDGIIAADMSGTIVLFNPAAEKIYGYQADEVIGTMNIEQLYTEGGAREVMRRLRSPHYGGEGRLEPTIMEAVDVQGDVIPIQLSAAMIYEGREPVATFGVFTDLREKMEAEKHLAEAQAKLEMSERHALVAEIAGAAAHELNQPLTSILACAELLKRSPASNDPRLERVTKIISSEVERMAEIVKKIGTLTRYETKDYVGEQRILDIERASEDEKSPGR